ncbi:MAG: hypothetical protein MI862_28615 [Desulfobacterales bacterium]|nr:hypothetical protein [Desulfobacterales bacterium]
MKEYIFGNLMDWGNALDKLQWLTDTGQLNNHQDELIRLFRFEGNWRLREAAIEASSTLANPSIDTLKQLVELMKRGDLYYNVRIMAAGALSALVPVVMENKGANSESVHLFFNEANDEVKTLLSSPEPPIFHDALNLTLAQIQKVTAVA